MQSNSDKRFNREKRQRRRLRRIIRYLRPGSENIVSPRVRRRVRIIERRPVVIKEQKTTPTYNIQIIHKKAPYLFWRRDLPVIVQKTKEPKDDVISEINSLENKKYSHIPYMIFSLTFLGFVGLVIFIMLYFLLRK